MRQVAGVDLEDAEDLVDRWEDAVVSGTEEGTISIESYVSFNYVIKLVTMDTRMVSLGSHVNKFCEYDRKVMLYLFLLGAAHLEEVVWCVAVEEVDQEVVWEAVHPVLEVEGVLREEGDAVIFHPGNVLIRVWT